MEPAIFVFKRSSVEYIQCAENTITATILESYNFGFTSCEHLDPYVNTDLIKDIVEEADGPSATAFPAAQRQPLTSI